jgi:hypothetical protein
LHRLKDTSNVNNLFPIHHTRAGRFPPIYRPALFCVLVSTF